MIFQKKAIVIFALLLLSVSVQTEEILTGLSLNPDLVRRTNCVLNDIKYLLGQYECSYLNGQTRAYNGLWIFMDANKFRLYESIKNFVTLLKQIKKQLAANNVVIGVGNQVTGVKNFVIGNYDTVSGNNDWIIASGYNTTTTSQLHEVLVIGTYQINLDLMDLMILDPSKVVECLNYQSKQAYFKSFGFIPYSNPINQQPAYPLSSAGSTLQLNKEDSQIVPPSFGPAPAPVPAAKSILPSMNWFGGAYAKILI